MSRELERGTHLEQPEEGDLIRRAALGDGDFLGVVQDILHDLRIRGVTGEGCQLECLAIGLESNLARELWCIWLASAADRACRARFERPNAARQPVKVATR